MKVKWLKWKKKKWNLKDWIKNRSKLEGIIYNLVFLLYPNGYEEQFKLYMPRIHVNNVK